MKERRIARKIAYHVIVFPIGIIMIYPLIWMTMSSFRKNSTTFSTAGSLTPENFILENYSTGWRGLGKISFAVFFKSSLSISIMATAGTVANSVLAACGFVRFRFRGRGVLFAAVLLSMMLPAQVLMIPQYLWYQKLGWVGSYLPLIIPYFLVIQDFFVYLISSFISGIPTGLSEAAKIDGCSHTSIFGRIMLPLIKPALVTACIFSFMWGWDDFLPALLYVSESGMYPVSLTPKLLCDPGSSSDYGAMFTMTTLSILLSILIFLFFQKYLVENISTSRLEG